MSSNNSPKESLYSHQLLEAIEKSRYYINYASEAGYEIPEEVLTVLVKSNSLIQTEEWGTDNESAFWKAFNKIAALIKPVTVESIQYSLVRKSVIGSKVKNRPSYSKIAVLRYSIATITVLAVLLSLQVYWYIGSDLVTSLQNNFSERDSIKISTIEYTRILGKSGVKIHSDDPELTYKEEHLKLANHLKSANRYSSS